MGYQLMAAALQPEWAAQLSPRELLTLVVMCQVALDEPRDGNPPGMYFAGHDLLILRIEGSTLDDDRRRRLAAEQATRRALRKLEQVGAIRRLVAATNAHRGEYLLTPWQTRLPVDNSVPDGVTSDGQPYTHVGLSPTPM